LSAPATIDNPYLPFVAGSRWVYEGESDGEVERIEIVEDTHDWYAQDEAGNVWYLGEEVDNYENGQVVDHDGSWEAGVDGALPGIVMPAAPAVGDAYRQEYLVGEAEDMGEVLAVDARVAGPTGSYTGVVTTRDWTPLEPDVVEQRDDAPGVGMIRETQVAGGTALIELVGYEP